MTRPKWQDAWQDAFENGFEEEDGEQGPSAQKKAVAIRRHADGSTEVVKVASGADADRMIAEAEAQGLEVESDASKVEKLMADQHGATDVPPEIYRLMSTVIDFARELTVEWRHRYDELLDGESAGTGTEIEYTMDDVES